MRALLSFLGILILNFAYAQDLNVSKSQWKEDILYYGKTLPKKHINCFHTLTSKHFDEGLRQLLTDVDDLTENEIYVRLMQLTARIGDGHTAVWTLPSFSRIPADFFFYSDTLRMIRATSVLKDALGLPLVQINDVKIAEIKDKISNLINSGESATNFLEYGAYYLPFIEILDGLGIGNHSGRVELIFRNAKEELVSKVISPIARSDYHKADLSWAYDSIPLFKQELDMKMLAEEVLYVNLREYPKWKNLKEITDKLTLFVDEHPTGKLIIDFRENSGGDLNKGRFIISALKRRNNSLAKNIYVVIGRGTFSAAMANSIDFRKELGAVLAGEITGGNPIQYGENDEFELPHSKLIVSYSTRFYKFQEEDTGGVLPDQLIEPSWKLHRLGRDGAIEWILQNESP